MTDMQDYENGDQMNQDHGDSHNGSHDHQGGRDDDR
jgi:hypothetical protein